MISNLPARRYRRCVYKAAEQNCLTQGVQSADCGILCVCVCQHLFPRFVPGKYACSRFYLKKGCYYIMVSGLATRNQRPLEPRASLRIKNKQAGTGMQKKKKTKKQGATRVPEERWPTKTSSGTRVNIPAFLITV